MAIFCRKLRVWRTIIICSLIKVKDVMDVNAQTFVVADGAIPLGEGQKHKYNFLQWMLQSYDDPSLFQEFLKGQHYQDKEAVFRLKSLSAVIWKIKLSSNKFILVVMWKHENIL